MSGPLTYLNIAMEGWGLLFCLLAVTILLVATRIEEGTKRYFLKIFLFLFLDLLSNMGGLFLRGQANGWGRLALRTANFCEYFFGDILTLTLTLYLLHLIGRKAPNKLTLWKRLSWCIFFTAIILLVFSQFTGIFYYTDPLGIYHRGRLFWLSQVLAIATLLFDVFLLMRYRDALTRAERISFFVYVSVPIVALILQLFFYGIYFLLLASTLAAVFMLGAIILDQTEQYYQTEQELTQMRSTAVLSQVQPHFLYNSLTAIAQLCEKAPSEAKQATLAFSEYLRTNMSTINSKTTVPFSKELDHIKTYLYLEQLRFGDDLQVVMDIQELHFRLPALTIQPLVENAVKWGVGRKDEGGVVTLSTRATAQGIEITVSDNGVGFDPKTPPADGKSHFGLQIVRSRLKTMCGASLTIDSKPGQGSVVRVFLPQDTDHLFP